VYADAIKITVDTITALVCKINDQIESANFQDVSAPLAFLKSSHQLYKYIAPKVDPLSSYAVIRETINNKMTKSLLIDETTPYAEERRKLDVANCIATHLHQLLDDSTKECASKFELILKDKVTAQFRATLTQIDSFSSQGKYFVEGKSIIDLMGINLQALVDANKLFSDCTFYSEAAASFNQVIDVHSAKFMEELPKEPTSLALKLSFQVLRAANQPLLKVHLFNTTHSPISVAYDKLFALYDPVSD
jgi:hypothetical protein